MYKQRVTYNGFEFPYVKLAMTEQTKLSDDNSTPLGTAYTFSISGVLADVGGGLLARLLEMRAKLTQPKRSFSVEWYNGTSWISLWSFTGPDDAWGPVPGQLNIRQIAGGRAAMFSWSVEVFKKQCFGVDCSLQGPASDVLSLSRRWDHTVDESGLTTRTVSGTLRIKRNGNTTADSWRHLVIPDVPPWYRRTSQNFAQSENGMELSYSIVDQEQYWTLPKPVIKGHAHYGIRYQRTMMVTHTLSGEFTGSTSATKFDLYTAMVALLVAKFPNYEPTATPTLIFTAVEVTESVYENSISFHISGEVAGGGDQDFNSALLRFYVAPPGSDGSSQSPNAYGSSGNGFSSGIISPQVIPWDSCGTNAGPGSPSVLPAPVGPGGVPVPTNSGTPAAPGGSSRPTVTPPDAAPTKASTDHEARPYLEFEETLSFDIDNRIVTFNPKADDNDAVPFVQRTGTPMMIIIQAGYWVRATKDNTPFQLPKPYGYNEVSGGKPKFTILKSNVSPQNAEPMGASGWFRTTLHWRYVLRAVYHLDDNLTGSLYNPRDPRHKTPITPGIGSDVDTDASKKFKIVERLNHS